MATTFPAVVYSGLCAAPLLYVASMHFSFLVRGELGFPRGVGGTYKRLSERSGSLRLLWATVFDLHRCFDLCSHFLLALTYMRQVVLHVFHGDGISYGFGSSFEVALLAILALGHFCSGTMHAGKYMKTPPWLQRAALTKASDVLDCTTHSCSGILYLNLDMRAWGLMVFLANVWFETLTYYEKATQDAKEWQKIAVDATAAKRLAAQKKHAAEAAAAGCVGRRSANSWRARECKMVG